MTGLTDHQVRSTHTCTGIDVMRFMNNSKRTLAIHKDMEFMSRHTKCDGLPIFET